MSVTLHSNCNPSLNLLIDLIFQNANEKHIEELEGIVQRTKIQLDESMRREESRQMEMKGMQEKLNTTEFDKKRLVDLENGWKGKE